MVTKVKNISRRMGARPMAEQPHDSPSSYPTVADRAVINTVVRRLGVVAYRVFQTIQSNLVSAGREEYAEALNDSLKPLCDMLMHFDIGDDGTEVDNGKVP